jgi:hypothetical protein
MTDLTNIKQVRELRDAATDHPDDEGMDPRLRNAIARLSVQPAYIEGMLVERGPKEKPKKEFGVCRNCHSAIFKCADFDGGWAHVDNQPATTCCGGAEPES